LQGKYIAECIDEIKQELRQENQAVKANAVNKLIYVSKYSISRVGGVFIHIHRKEIVLVIV
jgi:AP-3 complex subunit delta-1